MIYTPWTTYHNHTFIVQKEKESNGYMFKTNYSSIEQKYKKIGNIFNKKGGNIKFTHFMFYKKNWPLQKN